jgi:hypothetical protein
LERKLQIAEESLKRLDAALKKNSFKLDVDVFADVKTLMSFFEERAEEVSFLWLCMLTFHFSPPSQAKRDAERIEIMKEALKAKRRYLEASHLADHHVAARIDEEEAEDVTKPPPRKVVPGAGAAAAGAGGAGARAAAPAPAHRFGFGGSPSSSPAASPSLTSTGSRWGIPGTASAARPSVAAVPSSAAAHAPAPAPAAAASHAPPAYVAPAPAPAAAQQHAPPPAYAPPPAAAPAAATHALPNGNLPPPPGPPPAAEEEEALPPLPPGWSEHFDEEGDPWYFHAEKNLTSCTGCIRLLTCV